MRDWQSVLAEAASKKFESGQVLLLATVPAVLRPFGFPIGEIRRGRPWKETIYADAQEQLQLLRDPDDDLVWGVVPKSARIEDLRSLFGRKSFGPAERRFRKWFWAAFIKAIPDLHRRFIVEDRWLDVPASAAAPDNVVEVLAEDIAVVPFGEVLNNNEVLKKISAWSIRQNVELENYYLGQAPSSHPIEKPKSSTDLPDFGLLDPEDHKRIMVPLDLVLKLLRKPK